MYHFGHRCRQRKVQNLRVHDTSLGGGLRLNVHKVRTPTAELETKLALEKLDPLAMAMKIANATQMYTTGPGTKDKKGLPVHATDNTLTRTDIGDHRVCASFCRPSK